MSVRRPAISWERKLPLPACLLSIRLEAAPSIETEPAAAPVFARDNAALSVPSTSGSLSHRDFGVAEAERQIGFVAWEIGVPLAAGELEVLPKRFPRKVVCATLVEKRTAVPHKCLASRLAMGHPVSMSKHVHALRRDPAGSRSLRKHEET